MIPYTYDNSEYDLLELVTTLYTTYLDGILMEKDRNIYINIVNCMEQTLKPYNGNILLADSEIQNVCDYLRKIAFLYYKNSSKWADFKIYYAMLKALRFTHRIDNRDHEIAQKIKKDFMDLNKIHQFREQQPIYFEKIKTFII